MLCLSDRPIVLSVPSKLRPLFPGLFSSIVSPLRSGDAKPKAIPAEVDDSSLRAPKAVVMIPRFRRGSMDGFQTSLWISELGTIIGSLKHNVSVSSSLTVTLACAPACGSFLTEAHSLKHLPTCNSLCVGFNAQYCDSILSRSSHCLL